MRWLPAFGLIVLAGCSSLVPSTLAQIAATSPLEADPAAIEVALVLPPGLEVKKGSAVMTLSTKREDTGAEKMGRFTLQERPVTLQGVAVPKGAHVGAYKLAAADLAAVRALQDTARQWKLEAGKATSGSFGVAMGGCGIGGGPAADAVGSVYIRTETGGPFLPLIDNAALRDLLGAEVMAAIGPCDGPA